MFYTDTHATLLLQYYQCISNIIKCLYIFLIDYFFVQNSSISKQNNDISFFWLSKILYNITVFNKINKYSALKVNLVLINLSFQKSPVNMINPKCNINAYNIFYDTRVTYWLLSTLIFYNLYIPQYSITFKLNTFFTLIMYDFKSIVFCIFPQMYITYYIT